MRNMGKQPPARPANTKWKSDVYSFSIYQVDGLVSETLFSNPTNK